MLGMTTDDYDCVDGESDCVTFYGLAGRFIGVILSALCTICAPFGCKALRSLLWYLSLVVCDEMSIICFASVLSIGL